MGDLPGPSSAGPSQCAIEPFQLLSDHFLRGEQVADLPRIAVLSTSPANLDAFFLDGVKQPPRSEWRALPI
eukprot:4538794-Pleurochrysis_carterae.AAC.1